MLLKTVHRIEAFLFINFLALLTEALVDRELRRQMKAEQIPSLPCRAIQKRFYDKLTPLQCMVLRLLGLSPTAYFAAGDPGAS